MQYVRHHCPSCGHDESAPFAGVAAGDAGVWVCGNCKRAFAIRVELQLITEEQISEAFERRKVTLQDTENGKHRRNGTDQPLGETEQQRVFRLRAEFELLGSRRKELQQLLGSWPRINEG
jgi:ribosomal protein L37AE/L43A